VTALTAHLTKMSAKLELVISRPGHKILHIIVTQHAGRNPVVPILLANLPDPRSSTDPVNLSHMGSMLQFCAAVPRDNGTFTPGRVFFEILKTTPQDCPCEAPEPPATALDGLDALQRFVNSTSVARLNGEPQCSGQQVPAP
jgi:hypothetical protein